MEPLLVPDRRMINDWLPKWGLMLPPDCDWRVVVSYRIDPDTTLAAFEDEVFTEQERADFNAGKWRFLIVTIAVFDGDRLLDFTELTAEPPNASDHDTTLKNETEALLERLRPVRR